MGRTSATYAPSPGGASEASLEGRRPGPCILRAPRCARAPQDDGYTLSLENLKGRLFDIGTQHRMQAVAGCDVHVHAQLAFQKLFNPNQVECVEAAVGLVINEKVKVAAACGVVLSDRTEQVQRRRADGFYRLGLTLQLVDCFEPVHRGILLQ